MQIFYISEISGTIVTLSEEESKHCIRVLRLSQDDPLCIVDGKGNFFSCSIIDPNPKRCLVSVNRKEENFGKRNFHLHMAVAPTKNIDRFEWFLEKATEIGVDEITPILCEHSERKTVNIDRLERVIVAAMKQSVKAFLPKLNPITPFNKLLGNSSEELKLIAYCGEYSSTHAKNFISKNKSILFLIGPEGDFSPKEVAEAKSNGFVEVGLGAARLRTETAAVVACTLSNLTNEP
ncbi:MAG TPA: 16S rRNA (uracil(1498)-N(3))-methyltransferase [Tenuifilaceae bacterium]|nr:16S rRNA (uracil(1498)-N(3))-methyltransferase [Tenuifilaceae bacterium]HPE17994.1 16S rRNA (uracil(1498)-N(3))-methyltransferase [Tenuifilaceae bacterium]HPJ44886.1 16S rRNA (uracil(1498)-N(3))-methyltransferase [Tenuifilaceae bacterium]HPQ33148.1 16S rRNA (uracil(1498)-N(3))-methyltransferase [Tenuifilaceae bacterium]HRX67081.1 16S rRNA (uracil(1498)-N(3))-methyltransferase [Tenuifilaceae bacterium]